VVDTRYLPTQNQVSFKPERACAKEIVCKVMFKSATQTLGNSASNSMRVQPPDFYLLILGRYGYYFKVGRVEEI